MKKKTFPYSFYSVFLFVFTLYIAVEPYYNMDMLAYMAIVQDMEGQANTSEIHRNTYAFTKEALSPEQFKDLSEGTDYRRHLWQNADSFDEQLAFYVIKPLYLGLVFSFYKNGADLLFSTVLPSLISFFLLGLLLLHWFNKIFHSPWLTVWFSAFIITSIPFVTLGKTSAPDGMSTLFILTGCYFFIEKFSLWRSSLFFFLAIATRPDYVILVFMIFLIPFTGRWKREVPFTHLAVCLLLFFMTYFIPTIFLENVGWSTLFHHAFISRVLYPVSAPPALEASAYLKAVINNIVPQTFLARSQLMFIALFAGLTWRKRFIKLNFNFLRWSFNELFMLIIILTIGIRYLLFPAFLDRFMAPFIFLSTILFLKEMHPLLRDQFTQRPEPAHEEAKWQDRTV